MAASATQSYLRAVGLGLLAGVRSQVPLELAAQLAQKHPARFAHTPLRLLAAPSTPVLLGLTTLGEFVLDQLPIVPDRIQPWPLAGRMVCGALAGAVACVGARQPALLGAVLGALGGLVGTFASYHLRRLIAARLPGVLAGGIEDALALALGQGLLRVTAPADE